MKLLFMLMVCVSTAAAQLGGGNLYPSGWNNLYDPDGNYSTIDFDDGTITVVLSVPGSMGSPFDIPYCRGSQTDPFAPDWSSFYGFAFLAPTPDYLFPPVSTSPPPEPEESGYNDLSQMLESIYIDQEAALAQCFGLIDTTSLTLAEALAEVEACANDLYNDQNSDGNGSWFFGAENLCLIDDGFDPPTWTPPPPYIPAGTGGPGAIQNTLDAIEDLYIDSIEAFEDWCEGLFAWSPPPLIAVPQWGTIDPAFHEAFKDFDKRLKAINHHKWRCINTVNKDIDDIYTEIQWLYETAHEQLRADVADAMTEAY